MTKNFKIKDLYNRCYLIENLDAFISHMNQYHAEGTSIHEENGFIFRIDDSFRKKIKKFNRNQFK
tara:strand:+ start:304 stop:498 length:195 start_codon:yes stop_codon:yes gene_type:complete